jgi:hypothetical protein
MPDIYCSEWNATTTRSSVETSQAPAATPALRGDRLSSILQLLQPAAYLSCTTYVRLLRCVTVAAVCNDCSSVCTANTWIEQAVHSRRYSGWPGCLLLSYPLLSTFTNWPLERRKLFVTTLAVQAIGARIAFHIALTSFLSPTT